MLICDDQLIVWGPKKVLKDTWRDEASKVYKDGLLVIAGYWNPGTNHNISIKSYHELRPEERVLYQAKAEREYRPQNMEGCVIRLFDNNVNIRINHLFHTKARVLMSRYKNLVDIMMAIRPDLIDHRPREGAKEPERAFKEAGRNILNNHFKLQSYELDIFIEPEEGKVLRRELKRIAEKEYHNTIYVKEKKKGRGNSSIKMYDEAKKTGEEGRGAFYKLEITLRKEYFKSKHLEIRKFTSQDKIFKLLYTGIYKELDKMQKMLRETGGESMVLERIKKELHKPENNIVHRVLALEKDMEEVKDRLDLIERAGINQGKKI